MPVLSSDVSELLRAIKRAVKPSEADSARVLETLRERLGDLDADAAVASNSQSENVEVPSQMMSHELL